MTIITRIARRVRAALRVAFLMGFAFVTGYNSAEFMDDETMYDVARGEGK